MIEPIYIGDGSSKEFMDVLPDILTLNDIHPAFYKDKWSRPDFTIFKEVSVEPYSPSQEIKDFLAQPRWSADTTYEDVFEYLKLAILKVWNPDKFHIVGHSSGYDSRLICSAIRELQSAGMIGEDVFYVETMGEKPFRQIMDHLKLKGRAYNYHTEPGWYHAGSLRFEDFYEKYNGVFAFPFNQWFDAFKVLYHEGAIPKEVQGFTGYGAGEVMRKAIRSGKGFDWYFRYLYRFQLWLFRHWGGKRWEHPFLDFDVMKALEALPECYTHKRVAIPMAKHLVSELNYIPDWQTKDLIREGYRTVAPELLMKCYRDYKNSWFGKKFDVAPNPDINYSRWWFCYNAASLCEYLLKNGYKIKS